MRITGIEPARCCHHTDLNGTRLPVPPYPRFNFFIIPEKVRVDKFFWYSTIKLFKEAGMYYEQIILQSNIILHSTTHLIGILCVQIT